MTETPVSRATGPVLRTVSRVPRAVSQAGACALVLGTMVGAGRAAAQTMPDMENGRYTLAPAADGFVRLDTRSGTMSFCSFEAAWICRSGPDERAALDAEIGRLQAENDRLKKQIAETQAAASSKKDDRLPQGNLEKKGDLERKAGSADPKFSQPKPGADQTASAPPAVHDGHNGPAVKGKLQNLIASHVPSQQQLLKALDGAWQRLVALAGKAQRQLADKT